MNRSQVVDLLAAWFDQVGVIGPNDYVKDIEFDDFPDNNNCIPIKIYITDNKVVEDVEVYTINHNEEEIKELR